MKFCLIEIFDTLPIGIFSLFLPGCFFFTFTITTTYSSFDQKKKKKKKKKDSSLKTAKFKDPLPGFQRHENFLFAESHEDPEKSLDFSKPRDLSSMCRSQEEDLFP